MSMKSGLQRIFSGILVIALAITLSVPALATDLKSFSDVPTTFWAHDAIMDMVSWKCQEMCSRETPKI